MLEGFSKSYGEYEFSGHWMLSVALSPISRDITYKSWSRSY